MKQVDIISVTEGDAKIVSASFKLGENGVVVSKYNDDMIKRDLADGAGTWDDKAKEMKTFHPKDGVKYLKAIMRTFTGHRVRAVQVA